MLSTAKTDRKGKQPPHFLIKWAVSLSMIVLVVLAVVAVDIRPDLSHMEVTLLTGPELGNYHAFGLQLAKTAEGKEGRILLETSHGTVANLEALVSAQKGDCAQHFAFAQGGIAPPGNAQLTTVARLTRGEVLFLVGKDAQSIETFEQLRGVTIGAGPSKSGTDRLVRQIFKSDMLDTLDITLQNLDVPSQLAALEAGTLTLGAFVMDADATFMRTAVTKRGLAMVGLKHLDAIARRHHTMQVDTIPAGHFDPVAVLPPVDRKVLAVDTLVVGNGCASHAETVGLLSLLTTHMPGLIEHNRTRGGSEFMALSSSAKAFFDNQGPELVEEHVPWLVDLLPPSNWVYIVMTISVAFNVMGTGHRFRLWRIDANRVRVDETIRTTLDRHLTPAEIANLKPEPQHLNPDTKTAVITAIEELTALRERCRKQSMSMLVPMGQEMGYRYQEDQIEELLQALRAFRTRLL